MLHDDHSVSLMYRTLFVLRPRRSGNYVFSFLFVSLHGTEAADETVVMVEMLQETIVMTALTTIPL